MYPRKRQFNGVPFQGVIFQKAQRISAPDRGISFERPDRYLVSTPVGQLEICQGDWVVEFIPGRMYVIRAEDIAGAHAVFREPRKWWQVWRRA